MEQKTYNTRDSLVVTDPTTNPALSGLTRGERTGSRIFQMVWSYVGELELFGTYNPASHLLPLLAIHLTQYLICV